MPSGTCNTLHFQVNQRKKGFELILPLGMVRNNGTSNYNPNTELATVEINFTNKFKITGI